ncbi:MAG: histidine phosphatase family protein [Parahaliea sp.]
MDIIPTNCILLRHASCQVPTGYCLGQWDVALDTRGEQAARELGQRWHGSLPGKIFCSDLRRAQQSAKLLIGSQRISLHCDSRLREISLGDWEGNSWNSLYRNQNETLQHWGQYWLQVAPPGGESALELYHRVGHWLKDNRSALNEDSLVIAHAGSLQALICHLGKLQPQAMPGFHLAHCAPFQLTRSIDK